MSFSLREGAPAVAGGPPARTTPSRLGVERPVDRKTVASCIRYLVPEAAVVRVVPRGTLGSLPLGQALALDTTGAEATVPIGFGSVLASWVLAACPEAVGEPHDFDLATAHAVPSRLRAAQAAGAW